MLSKDAFYRLYRISSWWDLHITWPFMTPLSLGALWWLLGQGQVAAGLGPLPALGVYAMLFANFFGSVVVVWAVVRLRYDDPVLARYDAAGRWLFSAWMLYALMQGASPLIWGFLVIELIFAVLQSLPVKSQNVGHIA